MIHFFTDSTLYEKLNNILKDLFAKNINRFQNINLPLPQSEIEYFAHQIYKRGILDSNKPNIANIGNIDNISNLAFNTVANSFKNPLIEIETNLKNLFENIQNNKNTYFIIDSNVYSLHAGQFKSLNTKNTFYLEANETSKSLDTVQKILLDIRKNTHENTFEQCVVIGGGVTLDVGAFVASILKTKLILIPTTFLAAIDATVGGKTGVNFAPYGKNQIGSFYFCDQIIICPIFFVTLPRIEVISGLCEALKHSWIAGNFLKYQEKFEMIFNDFDNLIQNYHDFSDFILENLQTKLTLVAKDPYETLGHRTVLNFGHTLGHAIESMYLLNSKSIPHGIAVAHGMKFVIENYKNFHWQDTTQFDHSMQKNKHKIKKYKIFLNKIISEYQIENQDYNLKDYLSFLGHDKKNNNTRIIKFTLPTYGIVKIN